MTLQEIIRSLDDLPMQDQTSLFHVLERRLAPMSDGRSAAIAVPVQAEPQTSEGETFWEGVLRFRERIEREGIEFTDDDFAGLRCVAKADFARFDALMARVPDVEPMPGDELL